MKVHQRWQISLGLLSLMTVISVLVKAEDKPAKVFCDEKLVLDKNGMGKKCDKHDGLACAADPNDKTSVCTTMSVHVFCSTKKNWPGFDFYDGCMCAKAGFKPSNVDICAKINKPKPVKPRAPVADDMAMMMATPVPDMGTTDVTTDVADTDATTAGVVAALQAGGDQIDAMFVQNPSPDLAPDLVQSAVMQESVDFQCLSKPADAIVPLTAPVPQLDQNTAPISAPTPMMSY